MTQITATAPRQNAGGEGEGGAPADGTNAAAASPTGNSGGEENDNTLPIILGAGGLVLGAVALFVALRRRPA